MRNFSLLHVHDDFLYSFMLQFQVFAGPFHTSNTPPGYRAPDGHGRRIPTTAVEPSSPVYTFGSGYFWEEGLYLCSHGHYISTFNAHFGMYRRHFDEQRHQMLIYISMHTFDCWYYIIELPWQNAERCTSLPNRKNTIDVFHVGHNM